MAAPKAIRNERLGIPLKATFIVSLHFTNGAPRATPSSARRSACPSGRRAFRPAYRRQACRRGPLSDAHVGPHLPPKPGDKKKGTRCPFLSFSHSPSFTLNLPAGCTKNVPESQTPTPPKNLADPKNKGRSTAIRMPSPTPTMIGRRTAKSAFPVEIP